MRRKKGFTLIEVVVSLALLGIVAVAYLTIIGSGYNQLRQTSQFTVDTFAKQQEMESKILEVKNPATTALFKEKIKLFQGTAYASDVEVTHIQIPIVGNRAYDAFISHTKTIELPSPKIESFSVGVYQKNTQNLAFPWVDEINSEISELRGDYKISTEPQLYQISYRWYASKHISAENGGAWNLIDHGVWNPMFSSGYDIPAQWAEEPVYISQKTLTGSAVEAGKFYHFEIMPFTLYGKLAQQTNDKRILVQKKTENEFWNDIIENAYLKKSEIEGAVTTIEVMNRADRPTLHIAPKDNKINPEGALIKINTNNTAYETFNTELSYQFDKRTLDRLSSLDKLEMGIFLENQDNLDSGYMIEIDAIKKEIRLINIENDRYTSLPIQSHALNLDFSKEQKITLTHNIADNTIVAKIADNTNTETINFDIEPMKIANIGLKSYSSLPYISNDDSNLFGQYYRNYAVHFYDLIYDIKSKSFYDDAVKNGYFVLGTSYTHQGGSVNGDGASMIFTNSESWGHGGQKTEVTNIYTEGKVELVGSQNLGNSANKGEIIIKKDFIVRSSATSYGKFYIHGNLELKNTHVFEGDMYVNGNVRVDNGTTIKGDMYVNGDIYLSTHKIDITGNLYHYGNIIGNTSYLNAKEIIKINNKVDLKEVPKVEIPPPKSSEWYQSNGYKKIYSNTALESNAKHYCEEDYGYQDNGAVLENIILVSRTGDIVIDLAARGNASKLTGVIFAPNGKITLTLREFEGVLISKEGVEIIGNSSIKVIFKNLIEYIKTEVEAPF